MRDNIKELEAVSEELGLEYHPQDWGIINGSADRFVEFVAYFEQVNNDRHSNHVRMEVFELVTSSYNELLLEKGESDIKATVFNSFISKHGRQELFKNRVRYWAKIANDDEFPVGYFLLMRKPSLLADVDPEEEHAERFFSVDRVLYGMFIIILTISIFFKDQLPNFLQENWGVIMGFFLLLFIGNELRNRRQ